MGNVLINTYCWRVQPTTGGAIPRQLCLSCIRKQVKQTMERKPVNTIPQWSHFSSCLQVPTEVLVLVSLDDGL